MWVMGRKKELTEEEKVSMLRMLGSEVDKMFQSQRFVCQSTRGHRGRFTDRVVVSTPTSKKSLWLNPTGFH